MSLPLLSVRVAPRERHRDGAPARASASPSSLGFDSQDQCGSRPRCRRSCATRSATRAAAASSFTIEGERAPQLFSVTRQRRGPRHREPRRGPGGTLPVGHRDGARDRRVAPADGSLPRRDRAERGHDGHDGEAAARRRGRQSRPIRRVRTGVDALAAAAPRSALDEVQQQNHDLLRTLDELRRRQDESAAPEQRARGDQPRRRRPVRGARREGRSPAPRRRDEVAVPVEHEPRVPHAAELDARAHAPVLDRTDGAADRRAGGAGRLRAQSRRRISPSS